ncbi:MULTISPECIES: hypothetical protein [unclassified Coleofasciculus]|uniref:hypothetical protein n=1 Tax=unclassified Coleofasciculus TaxID=2692782 RepID=UPI00187E1CDA|nr:MULTISPECIES: hypothetical protein [unclassified Coleofasciculus]MBE9126885.1 hypothetical protein [Coleofasciculus sp. LEGE 07081]MBE9150219.1 hypothetical protein [Coleofasciculus sp. LEGE 07092]
MSGKTVTLKKFFQPIDRLALGVMLVLSLLIVIVLLSGAQAAPRVRDFSWQHKNVGADDSAFILTFSRPMNHTSVEKNLKLVPVLPEGEATSSDPAEIEGKISWAGRKMAYTLLSPLPYGNEYKLQLEGAKDQLPSVKDAGVPIEPYSASFRSRDRAFAYIGVEGEDQGRLILYNLTQQQKTVLTPADLVVMDFKSYPDGDRILFSANDRQSQEQGLLTDQLYTVTTGFSFEVPGKGSADSKPAGQIELVLDNQDYQNLQFDLSTDGETIVVQRVNRSNPAEFGLWIIQPKAEPKPLENQPGGEFLIAPDSASLAVAQGQGVALLPLKPGAEPLDFLPKFGRVLSFARDGSAATMVKYNADYTRSLYLVNNQGIERELLRTTGSIVNCEFTPTKDKLYCLLTQLIKAEEYQEEPFIAAIDLNAEKDSETDEDSIKMSVQPLVVLPEQRDIQMSLSPDGLALLFDQVVTRPPAATDSLITEEGQAIATGRLWFLPIIDITTSDTPEQLQPEQLLPGFHPRWLP